MSRNRCTRRRGEIAYRYAFAFSCVTVKVPNIWKFVTAKLIHPQKDKSTHSLSISPFFPELFSFSGFMKNRLSHYNYSFP